MATFYLALYPVGITPTWSIGSGWSGTPGYTDADTDPGTGSTYQFVPDASGLPSGTQLVPWAVWYDGATTVGPTQGTTFETLAATAAVSSDTAAAYAIRSAVGVDAASAYLVRASVTADAAAAYTTRASVSANISAAYAVESVGQVTASTSAAYSIRMPASLETTADYVIRMASSAEASASYAVRNQTQREVTNNYTVRGIASADALAAYTLFGRLFVDASVSYRILGDFGDFPDPSTVLLGTTYGPGGIYVGTLTPGVDINAIAAAVWAAAPALTVGKFIALK